MADMNKGSSKTTKDPEEIKRWVEERGGKPAMVKGTAGNEDTGLLRIAYEDSKDENLQEISWDDFFQKMKEKNLAFLYDDNSNDGKQSRFSKFIYDDGREGSGRDGQRDGGNQQDKDKKKDKEKDKDKQQQGGTSGGTDDDDNNDDMM